MASIDLACGPFWPSAATKETRWFSSSDLKPVPTMSVWCANKSLPPDSGLMKPKPFSLLNHFTIPVSVCIFLQSLKRRALCPIEDGQGVEICTKKNCFLEFQYK